jgi:2,4-dienoyl-CoA reductase-like NADH-dependent reductase (Old Yellow Enzyme family)
MSPIRIRNTEVRNRVVITSHGTSEAFRNPNVAADAYIEYLRRRAAGGAGLIIAQPQFPNPLGPVPASTVERHGRLAEAVKAEGAVLMIQLAHLGATFRSDADVHRPPLWGFEGSQTAEGETAHRMTDDEIERMIDAYRAIAQMAVDSGFDGVELHGAHGYLVQQSLSPWGNRREDKWGQDRTLFARRVIEAVRPVLGPDRILGYRTATDDLISPEDGGLGPAGLADTVRAILGTGEVDLVNTTVGFGGPSYGTSIPNYRAGDAPNIPRVVRMRELLGQALTVPMIGTGRIASPGVAERILADGDCDLVAMTRAHIADPDIVAKTVRGQAHRIRPCTGANVCVNRKLAGFPEISCLHNPEVLRELELVPAPAASPQRVLVVGAGPAGLKAAEIAARCGHHVRLLDAATRAGGLLRYAEHTAASALTAALDHLIGELAEYGVKPELGIRVDEALLREINPDFVVLATGARQPGPEAIPGGDTGHVVGSAEALDPALIGNIADDVLVYDTVGANEGPLVAEALAQRGKRVTYVTRYETIMPFGGALHRVEVPAILRRRAARVIVEGLLGDLDGRTATIVRADGETIAEIDTGTVVAVTSLASETSLAGVLDELGIPYRLAGDAVAHRTAFQAFKDGEEAALAVAEAVVPG